VPAWTKGKIRTVYESPLNDFPQCLGLLLVSVVMSLPRLAFQKQLWKAGAEVLRHGRGVALQLAVWILCSVLACQLQQDLLALENISASPKEAERGAALSFLEEKGCSSAAG
jgi:hypothetical protein